MGPNRLSEVFERVKTWPREDQEALAKYARELEAERTGDLYVMTAEEVAAVAEGLAQADRGEFVSEEDMTAFWKRAGTV